MRIAIVTLALILPAASAAEAPPPGPTAKSAPPARLCRDAFKVQPVREAPSTRTRRLGELPPGQTYLSVVNEVGGCVEPLTARDFDARR